MKLSFSYPSILNILLRKPSDEIHSNNRKELCFFFSLPFLFPRAVIPIIYPTLQDRLSNNISCHQLLKARNTTKPFYTMLFSAITKYTEKRLFNNFQLQIQMQIYFTTVLFFTYIEYNFLYIQKIFLNFETAKLQSSLSSHRYCLKEIIDQSKTF